MGGCPMPVVIVSGSGNQGITASVPIVVYARALDIPREKMLRALAVSDLISIYQKSGIGCLSAFCGAVSAGTGAACGITYLLGGRMEEIEHTIVNSLGTVSGMVCDGAKPSCAAKIAMAIESGVFGYRLFKNGNEFYAGDGIVTSGVDETIRNVSRMAREGHREGTDRLNLEHHDRLPNNRLISSRPLGCRLRKAIRDLQAQAAPAVTKAEQQCNAPSEGARSTRENNPPRTLRFTQ